MSRRWVVGEPLDLGELAVIRTCRYLPADLDEVDSYTAPDDGLHLWRGGLGWRVSGYRDVIESLVNRPLHTPVSCD